MSPDKNEWQLHSANEDAVSWLTIYGIREEEDYMPPIAALMHSIARQNRRATDHHIAVERLVHWPLMGGLLHLV